MTSPKTLCQSPLWFLLLIALGTSPTLSAHAQLRPSAELRIIHTETFDLHVQKNGRVDILLRSGMPLIQNAEPLIWFDGEDAPEAMEIEGRATMREEFNDRLGTGQAMRFVKEGHEWIIRVYPLRSYITVQAAYTNETRKQQTIRALFPWSAGIDGDGGVVLGQATDDALALGWPRDGVLSGAPPRVVRAEGSDHAWQALLFNPATGRSVLAGFLTLNQAFPSVQIAPSPEDRVDQIAIAAQCTFDPPAILEPAERIESEVLFITLTDPNPFRSLERFGQAYAASNGLRMSEKPAFVTRTLSPDSPPALPDAAGIGDTAADYLLLDIPGHKSLPLAAAWQDVINGLGANAGVAATPFVDPHDAATVQNNPSWYLPQPLLSGERVLDVSAPGAPAHVERFTAAAQAYAVVDLGHSVLAPLAIQGTPAQSPLARINAARALLDTQSDAPLWISSGAPYIAGLFSAGVRGHAPAAPRTLSGPAPQLWNEAETLAGFIRAYFLYPFVCRPVLTPPAFMTPPQAQVWYTAAAMLGASITGAKETFEEQGAVMNRALPVLDRPATPADLLSEDHPRIWHSRLGSDDEVHLIALFNWSSSVAIETSIPLAQFGMDAGEYYTVFDFWPRHYAGTAGESLAVAVPPHTVRLLGLRLLRDRPMVVAYDGHVAMGAMHAMPQHWDAASNTLSGSVTKPGAGAVHILLPEGWATHTASVNGSNFVPELDGRIVKLSAEGASDQPWSWQLVCLPPQ